MNHSIFPFTWRLAHQAELKIIRTTFPRLPSSKATSADPSASLFKQGLGTYRKAFRDKHTPLLITPLFIFKPPRRHCQIYPNTVWNLVSIRSNNPLCCRGSRQHLHVSRRLSCPPPLQQCGRQHGSGAGTKRRDGGDSVARTYRTEMPFKLSPHRHFDRNHTLCSKIRTKRR